MIHINISELLILNFSFTSIYDENIIVFFFGYGVSEGCRGSFGSLGKRKRFDLKTRRHAFKNKVNLFFLYSDLDRSILVNQLSYLYNVSLPQTDESLTLT